MTEKYQNLTKRPRRNRISETIREMVAETSISTNNLILPLFLCEGRNQKIEIKTMPGQFRFSSDCLLQEMEECIQLGIRSFALFPAISDSLKNSKATEALNKSGLLPETVRAIKNKFPKVTVITDLALDPFSSDGHDGLVKDGKILNDETNLILAQMALVHAEAGADIVAPSDMMDGRVKVIRQALDENVHQDVGILAYSAKYASGFYGPFRDALDSAPKFGDKKTYQMDFRNSKEALREVALDIEEGADMVMVKPALSYLDVIRDVKQMSSVPVAAYNVSGEYAMVKAAASLGMADETKLMVEILYSIKRAGADIILTYFAKDFAKWLRQQQK